MSLKQLALTALIATLPAAMASVSLATGQDPLQVSLSLTALSAAAATSLDEQVRAAVKEPASAGHLPILQLRHRAPSVIASPKPRLPEPSRLPVPPRPNDEPPQPKLIIKAPARLIPASPPASGAASKQLPMPSLPAERPAPRVFTPRLLEDARRAIEKPVTDVAGRRLTPTTEAPRLYARPGQGGPKLGHHPPGHRPPRKKGWLRPPPGQPGGPPPGQPGGPPPPGPFGPPPPPPGSPGPPKPVP